MNAPLRLAVPALLLLSLGAVPRALSAEYCHGWREPGGGARHRGFRCPERWDGEGARYCCGACALRYCCASPAARLDQSACPAETDHHSGSAQEIPPTLPTYLPFVIVFSTFLTFVLVGALISACCCRCAGAERAPPEGPGPARTGLLESGGPSPKSSGPGTPAPRPAPPDVGVYVAPVHQGVLPRFYAGYPGYPLPPEHTMLIGPAFLDPHGQVYPPPV